MQIDYLVYFFAFWLSLGFIFLGFWLLKDYLQQSKEDKKHLMLSDLLNFIFTDGSNVQIILILVLFYMAILVLVISAF